MTKLHRRLQALLKKTEKTDGKYTAGEKNNRAVFLERLGSVYRDENKPTQARRSVPPDDQPR